MENPTFELNGKVFGGPSFDVCSGGWVYHLSYKGGYIEHIVGSMKLNFELCNVVEEVYRGIHKADLKYHEGKKFICHHLIDGKFLQLNSKKLSYYALNPETQLQKPISHHLFYN